VARHVLVWLHQTPNRMTRAPARMSYPPLEGEGRRRRRRGGV